MDGGSIYIEIKNEPEINSALLSQQIALILEDPTAPIPDDKIFMKEELQIDDRNHHEVVQHQIEQQQSSQQGNHHQIQILNQQQFDDDEEIPEDEDETIEDDEIKDDGDGEMYDDNSTDAKIDEVQEFIRFNNKPPTVIRQQHQYHQQQQQRGESNSSAIVTENIIIKTENINFDNDDDISSIKTEYGCAECSEKFDSKEIYDIHKSGHANNMKCAICNMVLKSLKNYEKHCLRCKPYTCEICGRVVRFRPNFIKHMRVHTGQQSERHKYKCEVCHKEFMSFEYFKVHKKIHNENVNLTCEICGKVFSALASLRGHSKLHSGVKLHKCTICGKGFGQRYNLKIHQRTHTGEIPFGCKSCNKKFHTQSSLQAHMLIHQAQEHQQQLQQQNVTQTTTNTENSTGSQTDSSSIVQIKEELMDDDVDEIDAKPYPTTIIVNAKQLQKFNHHDDDSVESSDNVIKNDVQNGRPQVVTRTIIFNSNSINNKILTAGIAVPTMQQQQQQQCSSSSIESVDSPSPSSVLMNHTSIKNEPNFYSGENSVEMLIKKEAFLENCQQNSPPTPTKFHANFDDSNDLTSLSYSNLFEPNSIADSIPEDIYPPEEEPDDFHLDNNSLGFQSAAATVITGSTSIVSTTSNSQASTATSAAVAAAAATTTDGNFIKKEWVYTTTYTVNEKFEDEDEFCEAANFIYD